MSTDKTPKTTATKAGRAPRKKATSTEAAAPKTRRTAAKKATPKPAPKKKAAPKAAARKAPAEKVAPKAAKTAPMPPTHEQIAARAAEIWRETGGLPFDNWIRAERELAG